jgi:hypothetical protein
VTTGILLLHGSSGRPDVDRVRILEAEGYDVVAPRWFDQRISKIPLESFPLDELAKRNDRLAVMGISRGAEAALLLGTLDDRIDAVVGLSPSAYAWGWIDNGRQTSPWTWQGEPLPFVPFDLDWKPDDDPPSRSRRGEGVSEPRCWSRARPGTARCSPARSRSPAAGGWPAAAPTRRTVRSALGPGPTSCGCSLAELFRGPTCWGSSPIRWFWKD